MIPVILEVYIIMLAYDLAHQLARALRESDEYKAYCKARLEIENQPGALDILKDYKSKELQWKSATLLGQKTDELNEQIERLGEIIRSHPLIADFLTAENRLLTIIADVQKILGDSIDLWTYGLDDIIKAVSHQQTDEEG